MPTTVSSASDGSGAMFDRIAHRYDLLNRLMSFGIDRRWRRRTARALGAGERFLDLATGTGDLALEILGQNPGAHVVGVDPAPRMLERARNKAARAGLEGRLELLCGAGESLPFPDDSFDGAAIAFGIRNAGDRPRVLAEMARVTRPGGRLAVLELSEPRGPLGPLARFHIHRLIPRLGALLSGDREYRYLARSIAAFPPPPVFADLLSDAGVNAVETRRLLLGTCHLYTGEAQPS